MDFRLLVGIFGVFSISNMIWVEKSDAQVAVAAAGSAFCGISPVLDRLQKEMFELTLAATDQKKANEDERTKFDISRVSPTLFALEPSLLSLREGPKPERVPQLTVSFGLFRGPEDPTKIEGPAREMMTRIEEYNLRTDDQPAYYGFQLNFRW